MKNYTKMQLQGILFFILGVLWTLTDIKPIFIILGPLLIASGIVGFTSGTFKSKKYCNRILYNFIVALAVLIMLILDYAFAPKLNQTIYYILIVIMAIAFFMTIHFSFLPEYRQNRRKKIFTYLSIILLFGMIFIFFVIYGF